MRLKKIVRRLWSDIDARRWDNLPAYFSKNARIEWPNTGESFDAKGFRDVNGNYPGYWRVEVEKIIRVGRLVISVVKVSDNASSFHATSFFTFRSRKILALVEYWGEDGKMFPRYQEDVVLMTDSAPLPADEGEDMGEAGEASQPQEAFNDNKAQDAAPAPKTLTLKVNKETHKDADIVKMPQTVKKSAWTRLFFPDDAV
jgi:hypothetical protein